MFSEPEAPAAAESTWRVDSDTSLFQDILSLTTKKGKGAGPSNGGRMSLGL